MNRDRGVDQEKQQSSESAVHYDELNQLPPTQFRRWCGVDRHTFHAMVEVLRPSLERQGKRGGQNRLSVENQLVLTFQYWREYRTQFHIALDFGVSEATVSRPSPRLRTFWCAQVNFGCPANANCWTRTIRQTWLWSMSQKCPWNARKKTAELLQRQETTTHSEGAGGDRLRQWSLHCRLLR